jgi:hypothetical protein
MKMLRILDSSGDRVIAFDHTPDPAHARTEAQALFERMLGTGSVAFKVNRAGAPDEKVSEFSALEEETIVVPRLVAG